MGILKALQSKRKQRLSGQLINWFFIMAIIGFAMIGIHCSSNQGRVVPKLVPESTQPKAELRISHSQYRNETQKVLWTARAIGQVCIDHWKFDFGDGGKGEHEVSCENGSCCGVEDKSVSSYGEIHTYLQNGHYTAVIEVFFWGKRIGRTESDPVTVNTARDLENEN